MNAIDRIPTCRAFRPSQVRRYQVHAHAERDIPCCEIQDATGFPSSSWARYISWMPARHGRWRFRSRMRSETLPLVSTSTRWSWAYVAQDTSADYRVVLAVKNANKS